MSHTTRVVIVCDLCASTLPTSQRTNVRKARGEARASGWSCSRRVDLCGRCRTTVVVVPGSLVDAV